MKNDRFRVITIHTTAMTYTKFTSSQHSNDTMNNSSCILLVQCCELAFDKTRNKQDERYKRIMEFSKAWVQTRNAGIYKYVHTCVSMFITNGIITSMTEIQFIQLQSSVSKPHTVKVYA